MSGRTPAPHGSGYQAKCGVRRALNHEAVADRVNDDKELFRRQGRRRQSDCQEARDYPFFHLSIFSKVGMPARHGYGFCAGGPPVQDLIAKFQRVKRQVSVPVTEYGHGRRDRNPYGS